jgi:hypothetical protein
MGGIGAPEGCGRAVHLITEFDLTESNREISENIALLGFSVNRGNGVVPYLLCRRKLLFEISRT